MRHRTDFIVVHCSATPPGLDIGRLEIDQWHKDKGWNGIGYHGVIRRDGTWEKGRDVNAVGAHVKNYNSRSIGICLVGGVDGVGGKSVNNFTRDQMVMLELRVKDFKDMYPDAIVQGHRDFPNVKKDCPCFDVKSWWDSVKDNGI